MQYKEYLKTGHWKKKTSDMKAWKKRCAFCQTRGDLQTHHKRYKDKKGKSLWFNEDKYVLKVLCGDCHSLWHKYSPALNTSIAKKKIKNLVARGHSKESAIRYTAVMIMTTNDKEKKLQMLREEWVKTRNPIDRKIIEARAKLIKKSMTDDPFKQQVIDAFVNDSSD